MPFNPARYSLTAQQSHAALQKRREFEQANKHLALPFFVPELRDVIPDQFPGETALVMARSHEGKSLVLSAWMAECEKLVTQKMKSALTVKISHEETAEIAAMLQGKQYPSELAYQSSQIVNIGRSFGMNLDDIGDMNMGNVIRTLEYAQNEQFAERKSFAGIFYDYIQTTPPDPERRKMSNGDTKRFQMADDITRLFHAASQFAAPVVVGAQALFKGSDPSQYSTDMPIPGPAAVEEAKEIWQVPDRAYHFWLPARRYPKGYLVEEKDRKWTFEVRDDLMFLWVKKMRNYNPVKDHERYAPIDKVFPIFINPDGSFRYDEKYHKSIKVSDKE